MNMVPSMVTKRRGIYVVFEDGHMESLSWNLVLKIMNERFSQNDLEPTEIATEVYVELWEQFSNCLYHDIHIADVVKVIYAKLLKEPVKTR